MKVPAEFDLFESVNGICQRPAKAGSQISPNQLSLFPELDDGVSASQGISPNPQSNAKRVGVGI